ncbi:hypothetical protein H0W91_03965 [Patescibacteria group bacterium]|nr:hypothetical protein [Patescibacteria group bacterium]
MFLRTFQRSSKVILKLEGVAGENLAKIVQLIEDQEILQLAVGEGKVVTLKSAQDDKLDSYDIVLSVEEWYRTEGGLEPSIPMSFLRPYFDALEIFPEDAKPVEIM